ncbi:hypothetical protein EV715DRAFT_249315 [Schizophyllum commune]
MSFSNLRAARKAKDARSFATNLQVHSAAQETSVNPEPTAVENANVHMQSQDEPSPDVEVALQNLHGIPEYLYIRGSPTEGRGLWAKQPIKRGTVIIAVKPHVSVLTTQNLASYCSNCFEEVPDAGLKRCAHCRVVHYCNSECQNKDWATHKRECAALQEWAKHAPAAEVSVPSDAVRCLGRLLWKRQKKGLDSTWVCDSTTRGDAVQQEIPTTFRLRISHSPLPFPGAISRHIVSGRASRIRYHLARQFARPHLSGFATNSYSVTTPDLTPIGACVSPLVSLVNHSCSPNAATVFPRASKTPSADEPLISVVAIRDIHPDEQIFTSYIDTTLPRALRRRELQEGYNFLCECSLCKTPPPVDAREALWCPKSCGGMCPLPTEENPLTQCTKCKAVIKDTDAVLDATRVGQEGLDKATALQSKDPVKAIQLTTNLIPILVSAKLVPSSHPLLGLSRLHQTLLISAFSASPSQDILDEAIRTAARNTKGLSMILTEGHPVRGVALAEFGKLLAVDEMEAKSANALTDGLPRPDAFPPTGPPRLKLAYETLLRAREELLIGFGRANEGGKVGRSVRDALAALEKEIEVWRDGVRNAMNDTPKRA